MNRNEKILKLVGHWVGKIGAHEARKRLILRDLSTATAEKMVSGKYPSTPTYITAGILLEEMERDGITLLQMFVS